MTPLVVFIGMVLLVSVESVRMVPQCTCDQLDPCLAAAPDLMQTCADKCQKHVTDMGANYSIYRKCLTDEKERIQQVIRCSREAFGPSCAAGPGQTVEHRYPETLRTAVMKEVDSVLIKSDLVEEAAKLVKAGVNHVTCLGKCGSKSGCLKEMTDCGLELPSDNAIVATIKTCTQKAGYNTERARQICNCLVSSGMKQLEVVCRKLVL